MRYLLIPLLAISLFAPGAFAEFRGELLSYSQLMALSRPKRVEYIKDVRKLMVELEKLQDSREYAGDEYQREELREQVATIMQFFAILPAAYADETATADTPEAPTCDTKGCTCPDSGDTTHGLEYSAKVGTCVRWAANGSGRADRFLHGMDWATPSGCQKSDTLVPVEDTTATRAWAAYCVPAASAQTMDPARLKQLNDLKSDKTGAQQYPPPVAAADQQSVATKNAKSVANAADGLQKTGDGLQNQTVTGAGAALSAAAAKDDKTAAATAKPDATAKADAQSCTVPKFTCDAHNSAAEKAFRKDSKVNSCVSGGFFSTYPNAANKGAHQCKIVQKLADIIPVNDVCKPDPKDPEAQKACVKDMEKINPNHKPHQALCNPWLFCVNSAPGKPYRQWVDYGGKAGTDITGRCEKWYEKVTQPAKDTPDEATRRAQAKGAGLDFKACDDPSEAIDGTDGFKAAWTNIASKMEEHYKTDCLNNAAYQSLNCQECQIMADRISKMTKKAISSGCAADATPAAGGDETTKAAQ